MPFQLITDGSWDMGTEKAKDLEVDVIPYYVSKDGITYEKEVIDISVRNLYEFMVDNPTKYPKTSLPSISDYIDTFTKYAKNGIDIICCTLSKSFSGSYNSAINAKEIVKETYDNVRIEIVDTIQATLMQGLIVEQLALAKKSGFTYEQILSLVETIKERARIFFTIGNMDYLIHGGRVGKLAGLSANLLRVSPLICLYDGELQSAGLVHGRKKGYQKIIKMLTDYINQLGGNLSDFKFMVGFGYDEKEGPLLRDKFLEHAKETWDNDDIDIEIECMQIGATIGVHTGPYPIGFGIVDKFTSIDIDSTH